MQDRGNPCLGFIFLVRTLAGVTVTLLDSGKSIRQIGKSGRTGSRCFGARLGL